MYPDNDFRTNSAVIKVMGIGGGGCNAINSMINSNITSAQFIAVNTDSQALLMSKADMCLQIGEKLTKGLGAGSNPNVGEAAAEESKELIENALKDTDLLFIASGMGGGTGTGASSVIARIAKEMGILTIAVVTKPFTFEGRIRNSNAVKGIENLRKYVDTLVVIPNDKLLQFMSSHITMKDAFKVADDMLKQGIIGIVDLIATPSFINLDFADVNTVMRNQGLAHMGIGKASGDNRVIEAVRQAVSSPLLETTIEGAKSVILNVTGGNDLLLEEVNEAASLVQGIIDEDANIIFGNCLDETMENEIKITVIATGFIPDENSVQQDLQTKININDYMHTNAQIVQESVKSKQDDDEVCVTNYEEPDENKVQYNKNEEPKQIGLQDIQNNNIESNIENDKKNLPPFMQKLFGKRK